MTPHEKAVNAINARLERLQANLRDAKVEAAQHFLLQSVVVTVGAAEALNDFVRTVGDYAQRRHAAVRQDNDSLGVQHADLLKAGQEQLEKLKANPTDREIRKEIERTQQGMAAIQKTLKRSANTLQRELAPGLAMIDEMAVDIRRFSEADQADALRRVVRTLVGHVQQFYADVPTVPTRDIVDAAAWEKSIGAEIDQSVDLYDAYARVGFQVILALELMSLAVSEDAPASTGDASSRANAAVIARVKDITARLTKG